MEITLKDERPALTVNYGGEQMRVPLTLNRMEMVAMGKAEDKEEAIFDFFRKYLGDAIDEIGDDDLGMLVNAWNGERKAIGTPTMGER